MEEPLDVDAVCAGGEHFRLLSLANARRATGIMPTFWAVSGGFRRYSASVDDFRPETVRTCEAATHIARDLNRLKR